MSADWSVVEGAVLERVRDVEEPAEPGRRAARHARVDPLPDAHAVESHARRGLGLVGRLVAGRVEVPLEQRVDGLELPVRVGDRVEGAEDVIGVLRPRRLAGVEVDRLETEAPGQAEDGLMVGVDELAAPLAHLAVPPIAGSVRVDPAADLPGGLVHGDGDARVVQGEGGGESAETRADDGDDGRRLPRRRLLRRRGRGTLEPIAERGARRPRRRRPPGARAARPRGPGEAPPGRRDDASRAPEPGPTPPEPPRATRPDAMRRPGRPPASPRRDRGASWSRSRRPLRGHGGHRAAPPRRPTAQLHAARACGDRLRGILAHAARAAPADRPFRIGRARSARVR